VIEGTISKRYARALIGLAEDQVDEFGKQIKAILDVCVEDPNIMFALSNAGYSIAIRQKIVDQMFENKGVHQHIKNFIKILIQKSRMELLPLIYEEYLKMADDIANRLQMTVVSAVELPHDQYQSLVNYFSERFKKEIILNKKIDADVLGGVKVQIGDQIFDYTLGRQLFELKQRMIA